MHLSTLLRSYHLVSKLVCQRNVDVTWAGHSPALSLSLKISYRRSQGVHWVHLHPQGGEKNLLGRRKL